MYHRRSKLFIIILLACLLGIGCAGISNKDFRNVVKSCMSDAKEDIFICRGLTWLNNNPVDLKADGFLELGEELNLLYKLYLRADNFSEKRFFKNYIKSKIDYLLNSHDLKVDFAGEITAYLNFAKIMKRMDIERPAYSKFIDKDILNNPMTYPPNITYSILNSALVEDIGHSPKVPFNMLVSQGVIARFARQPELIPIGKAYASDDDVMNFFYDITHEVFAVSNFGDRDPLQFLLEDEVQFLKGIISQGVTRYIEKGQVDILAELVICAKMIKYTDFNGFNEAVQFIIDSQREDGSFGIIQRMAYLGRPNLYRHGVLVAMWALVE